MSATATNLASSGRHRYAIAWRLTIPPAPMTPTPSTDCPMGNSDWVARVALSRDIGLDFFFCSTSATKGPHTMIGCEPCSPFAMCELQGGASRSDFEFLLLWGPDM